MELDVVGSFFEHVKFFVVGTHLVISECRIFHDLVTRPHPVNRRRRPLLGAPPLALMCAVA